MSTTLLEKQNDIRLIYKCRLFQPPLLQSPPRVRRRALASDLLALIPPQRSVGGVREASLPPQGPTGRRSAIKRRSGLHYGALGPPAFARLSGGTSVQHPRW